MPKDFIEEEEIIDWSTIEEYQAEGSASGLSMALAECYKLLNFILTEQGYQGNDLREKIKNASSRFSDLTAIQSALIVHQNIFQEYEQEVSHQEVERAIRSLQDAIRDIAGSEPPSLGFWGNTKNFFTGVSLGRPGFWKRLFGWILIIIIGSILLDTTHFGQNIVSGIAFVFKNIFSWFFTLGLILLGAFIAIISMIVYLEKRKRGKQ